MASAVTWSARILLAVLSAWFLLGLAWLGGDMSFVSAGVLLAAVVAASFRWPDAATLLVMLLFAFSLFLFVVTLFF